MEKPPPPMAPSGPPSPRRGRGNWWGLGAFLALVAGKLKFFLPALKFLPLVLKAGGSMLLMIGVYTLMFGWKFAVGFVLLIFVHEIGHVLAAQRCGVRVSAPFFIPFFGALIMLKELPKNAWTEARIAIGGPLLGAIAAGACHALHVATGHPLLLVLAYFGYWLNLFNLAPVGFFDGGRIVTAISPWMWLVGFSGLGTLAVWRFRDSASVGAFLEHNFILLVVLSFALPRIFWLFGSRKSPEQLRYFEVTSGQRATMAVLYFGLAGLLAAGMFAAKVAIAALDLR